MDNSRCPQGDVDPSERADIDPSERTGTDPREDRDGYDVDPSEGPRGGGLTPPDPWDD